MKYILFIVCFVILNTTYAQPPAACGDRSVITYFDPVSCGSSCAVLHAQVKGENPLNAGVTFDDRYTGVLPIGFNFNFYGVNYTQCVIGSNGMINFNVGVAGTYHPWPISAALLGNASARNAICGPWCDMDITTIQGGTVTFATSGVAPFRRFTATWCTVPMYNNGICAGQRTTTQIILYETCNLIDVHVRSKTICAAWNNGRAIIGVQNAAGTNAVVPPGRNFNPAYACTNEAWRFTPAGPTYTVASIAYHPVPLATSPINWYNGASLVGTGATLPCATPGQTYRAEVAGCNTIASSTVSPVVTGSTTSDTFDVCIGATDTYTLPLAGGGIWSGGNPAIATINTGTSTITGISAGTTTYTYTYAQVCVYRIVINVTQCCSDTCAWVVTGNNIYGTNNIFGTLTNNDIRILSNNNQRAVIKAGGFMGIKQLTPTTTLNVDCVPTSAPSGLRLENLPYGHGNVMVVDANGYVYLAQNGVYKQSEGSNEDLQSQIDKLTQKLEDLTLQLSLLDCLPCENGDYSLQVTPNPNNGRMNITYKINGGFESAAIKVMDGRGSLIKTTPLQTSNSTVAIELPASVVSGNVVVIMIVDGKAVARQKVALVK
jgi:hypothetical protein